MVAGPLCATHAPLSIDASTDAGEATFWVALFNYVSETKTNFGLRACQNAKRISGTT